MCGQHFTGLCHKSSWEIRAKQAETLVVVQGSYYPVVGGGVENGSHLAHEACAVVLGGRNEGVVTEEDVLAFEGQGETE